MRHIVLLSAVALGITTAIACSSSSDVTVDDTTDGGDPGAESGGSVLPPPSGPGTTGPAGTGLQTGLPCEVQGVLENRCIACHSGNPEVALLTYEDLMAVSKTDASKTRAQLSLERMKSTTSPMPPKPAEAPDADEIKIFEDWVNAGTPKGGLCTDTPPDAGAPLPDGGDAGVDAGPSKCTSGTTWKDGDQGSPLMHPGTACHACHQKQGGPNLRIAGTVYPSLHEPNDCNGKAPPPALTVVITDKAGKVTRLPVNAAGNFSTRTKIAVPYKALVTDGTKTRAMVGSVTAGDCNSCHTETGANAAPGRIMAP
jgi:hypothetical protein